MPDTTVQGFLADATQKAAADLITALDLIPADKRGWQPGEKSRSALNQLAECAIINGATADAITTRSAPTGDFMGSFFAMLETLARDEEGARALLATNTARLIDAIRATDSADLDREIAMPWGVMTLQAVSAVPYWNLTYHQGQITYISTMI